MSLSSKTIAGIVWNFGEQLLRRGVQVITTLLLAYFLTPADYGLVAMMAVFIAIASSIMDSGFKQALVRLPDAKQVDYSTIFYTNIALGIIAYLVLFFIAPFVAKFYSEPQLTILLRVAGTTVIIQSLNVVQGAIFTRDLNFKIQLKANLPAAIISAIIAITLAFLGFGVWALIAQMLLSAAITVALFWKFSSWRPTAEFSKHSLKGMYNFGYKLMLSGFLDTIFKNITVVIIGKLFTSAITGLYYFAINIRDLITSQLVGAIQSVTYPALSQLQNDNVRLKEGYRKIIVLTTFVVFPVFAALAVLAEPFFDAFLPEHWSGAVGYLQYLCVGGMLFPLHAINLNILLVKGRSDLFFYLEIVKKVTSLIILFVSVRYGIYGILIGQIINSIIAYLPNSFFTVKLINYSLFEQFRDFIPNMLVSFASAIVVYLLMQKVAWASAVTVIVFGIVFVIIYLLVAYLFKFSALNYAYEIIEPKIKKLKIKKHKTELL